jgi:hypothetical protein
MIQFLSYKWRKLFACLGINFPRIVLAFSVLVFSSQNIFSQSQDSVLIRSGINSLTQIWQQHVSYFTKTVQYDSITSISKLFPAPTLITDTNNNPALQLIEIRKQQLHADKGLSVNGGYNENFAGGNGGDDILYRRRFQAGVDWDVLNGGLYGNKKKEVQLDNEARIAELKQIKRTSAGKELATYNTIIFTFNREKTDLLAERKNISNSKLELISKLYSFQAVSYLIYLDAQQQQADIASMYNLYAAYNIQMKTIIVDSLLPQKPLPIFDIDSEKMFALAGSKNISDSINALVLENMRLENSAVNNIKLDFFVRYNYYDYGAVTNQTRNFASAGVGFSMPILFGRQNDKKIILAQQQVMTWEQSELTNISNLTLANSLYDFRYKLKQYEGFLSKRREYVELLRIERVKQQFNDLEFNPITGLNILDQLMQIDIELMDIRQQLYLTLLDINHELPGINVNAYLKTWTPMAIPLQQQTLNKSIYIWSNNSADYSTSFITEFLLRNEINNAIVSPGKTKESYTRAKILLDSLHQVGIHTELLLGENSLLKRKNQVAYIDSVLTAIGNSNIDAIHLDVEPHTLSDWDTKKDSYLSDYLKMVHELKIYCTSKGLKLSVSIPVFYPETFLQDLYTTVDHVYVMAYEQTDPDKIVNKTKEERALGADKTIIAIRTKDFADRQKFDDFLFLLSDKLKTKDFAIHDFNSLVKLNLSNLDGR